jgi:hypothetical protein
MRKLTYLAAVVLGQPPPIFRVCQIGFESLLEIQLEAERLGLATRWSSASAHGRASTLRGNRFGAVLTRAERACNCSGLHSLPYAGKGVMPHFSRANRRKSETASGTGRTISHPSRSEPNAQ